VRLLHQAQIATAFVLFLTGCDQNFPLTEKQKEQDAFILGADARESYNNCIIERNEQVCNHAITKFETASIDMTASCKSGNRFACEYLPKYKEGPNHIRNYLAGCILGFDKKFTDARLKIAMDKLCNGQLSKGNIQKLKKHLEHQG
jgi:hypothetical protein